MRDDTTYDESILHQNKEKEQEENEVSDDKTINQMNSRSKEEFKLFENMDIEY